MKESVRIDPLKEKLQPYFETLLYEVVIPLMMMSNRDITQFNDDPIEFIRSIFDFLESIFMPKNTTLELQSQLCKFKSDKKKGAKPDYLIPFLNFAADNMKQYNEQLAAGANPDWRIKEALLHSIGNISETISFDKDIVSSIEPMLLTHVLPFLTCDNPYLKHRSCWVYGRFAQITFTDDTHITSACEGIFKCLQDDSLPVRFAAAQALSELVSNETA